MAECLSTDLFQRAEALPSCMCQRTGARFRPTEATLTSLTDYINGQADDEQNCECCSEQEFCRQQLPHEVQLKNEGDAQRPPKSARQLLLLNRVICEQFRNAIHNSFPFLTYLDARAGPKDPCANCCKYKGLRQRSLYS